MFFQAIARSGAIESCLAILRLPAIRQLAPEASAELEKYDDADLVAALNDESWYVQHNLDLSKVADILAQNEHLQRLPDGFPLFGGRDSWVM